MVTKTKTGVARIELMELADLREAFDKRNAKKHDHEAIRASMKRYGFKAPPVLNEQTGKLSAGHGRVESLIMMRAAGEDAPDGVAVERGKRWLVPVVRGLSLPPGRDVEYLFADNRLVEIGGWDSEATLALLRQMEADALKAMGYDPEELLAGGDERRASGPVKYGIRIECKNEKQRDTLQARLERQGFTCVAVTSAPRARKMR